MRAQPGAVAPQFGGGCFRCQEALFSGLSIKQLEVSCACSRARPGAVTPQFGGDSLRCQDELLHSFLVAVRGAAGRKRGKRGGLRHRKSGKSVEPTTGPRKRGKRGGRRHTRDTRGGASGRGSSS